MHLIHFRDHARPDGSVGLLEGDLVRDLGCSLPELLSGTLEGIRRRCEGGGGAPEPLSGLEPLAPVAGRMEVWAAGVTYERSRDERMRESTAAASVYDTVYGAQRPELFLKAVPWRVVRDGEPIGVRGDSAVDVPEPELALVCNGGGEIVGYTVCDDVSSRSIEGENPLYLPQAKVYTGSCALAGPFRPAWEVADPYRLEISVRIERAGEAVYEAAASTGQLHRRLDELVRWCFAELDLPDGAILSTGTCLVPELPFTLEVGDLVRIAVEEVGSLANPVALASSLRRAGQGAGTPAR
jgi:2-dehydro-3-deoxy-D-arabinonate dehydratase